MEYRNLHIALASMFAASVGVLFAAYFVPPRLAITPRAAPIQAVITAPTPVAPPTEVVPPPPPPPKTVTLLVVGDIMLSRSVASAIKKAGDVGYPFAETRDLLHSADIVFANLETSITAGRDINPGEMTFRADPKTVESMKVAGVTIVSLANNHVPNFGAKGILDTVSFLDAAGIAHAGAGKDDVAASASAIVERGGVRFAFLAFNDADVVPASYGAAPNHPGTILMDSEKMAEAVTDARKHADIVAVSMHSGIEYTRLPNEHQTTFAHAAIDAGADIVIGHHPHVVQTMEIYKGKPILYSLGNFIFDQDWSEDTKKGLAVRIIFGANGAERLEFIPIYIAKTGQPIIASDAARDEVLTRLGASIGDLTVYTWDNTISAPTITTRKALVIISSITKDCSPQIVDLDDDGVAEYVAVGKDGDCGDGRVTVSSGVGNDMQTIWQSTEGGFKRITIEARGDKREVVAER